MRGPTLTKTDVEQKLVAICEEPFTSYPKDELKNGCIAVYQSEKSSGTEMRHYWSAASEREEDRLHREREENYRRLKEEERVRLEQRFTEDGFRGPSGRQ